MPDSNTTYYRLREKQGRQCAAEAAGDAHAIHLALAEKYASLAALLEAMEAHDIAGTIPDDPPNEGERRRPTSSARPLFNGW